MKPRCVICGKPTRKELIDILITKHGKESCVASDEIDDKPYWEKPWGKRIMK